jgi:hypothetical protein
MGAGALAYCAAMTSTALPLDSDRWAELEHAYGEASDVPAWLEALGRGDETIEWDEEGEVEIWHPIWSALCHQGSVYTASHAAVPHLVALALAQEPAARRPYWQIVGAIAVSDDAPPSPPISSPRTAARSPRPSTPCRRRSRPTTQSSRRGRWPRWLR